MVRIFFLSESGSEIKRHTLYSLLIMKKDSRIKNRISFNLCKLSNLEKHLRLQFCSSSEQHDTHISLWHSVIAKQRELQNYGSRSAVFSIPPLLFP